MSNSTKPFGGEIILTSKIDGGCGLHPLVKFLEISVVLSLKTDEEGILILAEMTLAITTGIGQGPVRNGVRIIDLMVTYSVLVTRRGYPRMQSLAEINLSMHVMIVSSCIQLIFTSNQGVGRLARDVEPNEPSSLGIHTGSGALRSGRNSNAQFEVLETQDSDHKKRNDGIGIVDASLSACFLLNQQSFPFLQVRRIACIGFSSVKSYQSHLFDPESPKMKSPAFLHVGFSLQIASDPLSPLFS
ncbi:hypothetical protein VNO77_19510 [Canavalia gladiata]|uniref:Uncharacterized protein n=1 Tax=Canavalia gladiata TaxID=3824 RepID=A0AAN9LNI1_CANGL